MTIHFLRDIAIGISVLFAVQYVRWFVMWWAEGLSKARGRSRVVGYDEDRPM